MRREPLDLLAGQAHDGWWSEEVLMVHACACCRLRFASTGELADHVHAEHDEHRPFEEGTVTVTRRRFPTLQPAGQPTGTRPRS